ncbi:MAG TPA: hydroxymyristoyl-ACP dehydratase [Burkholderiaceae bacterium]|nr:hydroxymyristoyl-ACP dehydratase [Burkholderiaceae bacterium]
MTASPATLERAGIAARIPHAGAMCLLERMLSWRDDEVVCEAINQADERHPLRLAGTLPAACALEYASQAMALHGALCARVGGPQPGFLASARSLRLHASRLDDAPGPLRVHAQRLSGGAGQAMYAFTLRDGHARLLVDGRATVVFDAPLRAAESPQ